jgi:hypothetical protein
MMTQMVFLSQSGVLPQPSWVPDMISKAVQDSLKMIGITAAAEQMYRRGSFCALCFAQSSNQSNTDKQIAAVVE